MPGFLADVLTQPRNYTYLISVQTAMDLRLPPTTFIYEDRQGDKWTPEDKKLAIAWTILQKETCGICGQPLWICRSDNRQLGFKVKTSVCYSDKELNSKQNKKKSDNLKPGERLYTVPYMYDDSPLPSRAEYYKSLEDE